MPIGDGQVERGTRLAQIGRREVDRDPAGRERETAVADRAADPLASLLERGIRQADDREPGQARRDVDLDPDDPAVDAVERRGVNGGEHAGTLPKAAHPGLTRLTRRSERRT